VKALSVSYAQDIVFSQFEQVASYYNPAYAGFGRALGAGMSVRNQWGNTNGDYFYTYVFGDYFFDEYKSGGGLDFSYSDANSGASTNFTVGARYNYHLTLYKKWTTAIGLSASYASVKMITERFVFEDQLNPSGGTTATSENVGVIESRGYFDLGIGTVFYVEEQTEFSLGLKHINFPHLKSLHDEKTPIKPMVSLFVKHRIKVAGSFYRPDSRKVFMLPSLLFLKQAQFNQVKFGSAVEIELVQFGLYYRTGLGKLETQYTRGAAFVLMGGLKTESFNMTYSYDMDLSSERIPASSHEVSLIYIKKSNKLKGMRRVKKRRK